MTYHVLAEKASTRPGQKIMLRVDYPSFSEAWLSMRRLVEDGWRITQCPEPVEFPQFPLENAA